ncbi:Amino acid transporter AVT1A-like protein [Drosera capensis]
MSFDSNISFPALIRREDCVGSTNDSLYRESEFGAEGDWQTLVAARQVNDHFPSLSASPVEEESETADDHSVILDEEILEAADDDGNSNDGDGDSISHSPFSSHWPRSYKEATDSFTISASPNLGILRQAHSFLSSFTSQHDLDSKSPLLNGNNKANLDKLTSVHSWSTVVNCYQCLQLCEKEAGQIVFYIELYFCCVQFVILEADNPAKLYPSAALYLDGLYLGLSHLLGIIATLVVLPTCYLKGFLLLSVLSDWYCGEDQLLSNGSSRDMEWSSICSWCVWVLLFWPFCAPNLYHPMEDKKKFKEAVIIIFILSASVYVIAAVLGFLMFGEDTDSQITLNLPKDSIASQIALWITSIIMPSVCFLRVIKEPSFSQQPNMGSYCTATHRSISTPRQEDPSRHQSDGLRSTRRFTTNLTIPSLFSIPTSPEAAMARISNNMAYFKFLYGFFWWVVLFISLIPVRMLSLILLVLMTNITVMYLLILRSFPDSSVLRFVDRRLVLTLIGFATAIELVVTDAGLHLLITTACTTTIILVHSVLQINDCFIVDGESSAAIGEEYSLVGFQENVDHQV